MAYYDRAANLLRLINDAGTAWLPGMLGTGGTIENGACAIALGSSVATPSGSTLTLSLAITFKPAFAGTKNIYMYANGAGGTNSGWQARGTYAISAGASEVVTADSVTPSSGSGAAQTFALQYSDTLGATQLRTAWVWINATFASTAAGSCMAYYDRPANTLYLINDSGTGWLPAVLGGGGTLQNSSCAIDVGPAATATPNGNALTLTLPIAFSPGFAGAKTIFMYANGVSGANSDWQTRGSWTVP